MFDAPVDAWYTWVGVATVSLAVFGVVLGLPAVAPPDAATLAETVDSVASSPYEASATVEVRAERLRLGSTAVVLRNREGTSHATFAYAPVVPVVNSTLLGAVVDGRPPHRVFDSKVAFRTALDRARNRPARWRDAPPELTVRRVTWEGINGTLVGA
ncbi:hypothetical protein VB773_17580 [Haloarculaceae archaeon H-GB2-1]|nr:hypothetical protein [Haloarculaceae archaeon H-GB1-1]MEA5387710.1 hypothetical protein [Haloarculaceae archaeon H-GB11]MEA5409202.1 hypothetical protein [Haloarculaceae archaeon H-GB2-1]